MADIAGRPQWELHLDEKGRVTGGTSIADIVAGVVARGVTDLFVFSHGLDTQTDLLLGDEEGTLRWITLHPPLAAVLGQHGIVGQAPADEHGAHLLQERWILDRPALDA